MKINIFEGARRIAKLVTVLLVCVWGWVLLTVTTPNVSVTYLIKQPGDVPIRLEDKDCSDENLKESKEVYTRNGRNVWVTLCIAATAEKFAQWIVANKDKKGTPEFETVANAYRITRQNRSWTSTDPEFETVAEAFNIAEDIPPPPEGFVLDEPIARTQPRFVFEDSGYPSSSWRNDPIYFTFEDAQVGAFVIPLADEDWIESQWWSNWWSKRWGKIKENGLILIGGLAFFWGFVLATGWIVRGFLGIPMGQDRKPDTDSTH
ncbi:MAG: hypothetical protein HY356_02165 [Gammaproteobacteria bacterium]|nr:hypothetical protein [Gammaproteobacteria bacterium]